MLTRLIAGVLASLLPLLVLADVYKWVDAEGRTHYSNVPPKNVKTRRVEGGGVTVVPALVVPPAPVAVVSAPAAAPAAASAPARTEPEARVSAPVVSAPTVPASAVAGGERAYDPAPAPAPAAAAASEPLPGVEDFKPMPGWSQPPIRPRGNTRPVPGDDAAASAPRNQKSGSLSPSPAASKGVAPAQTSKQD